MTMVFTGGDSGQNRPPIPDSNQAEDSDHYLYRFQRQKAMSSKPKPWSAKGFHMKPIATGDLAVKVRKVLDEAKKLDF